MKLLVFAVAIFLTFGSTLQENERLRKANKVLLNALSQLSSEKAVAYWDDYEEPTKDCSSFYKDCQGCRGYLDSCCSDKNCASGRKCKAGLWSYSCDSATEQESSVGDSLDFCTCSKEKRFSGWAAGGEACQFGSNCAPRARCKFGGNPCVFGADEESVGQLFEHTDRMKTFDTCDDRTCIECLYGRTFEKCSFYEGQCYSHEDVMGTLAGLPDFDGSKLEWDYTTCEEYTEVRGQEYGGRTGRIGRL